jgi:hypothetical protein
MKCRMLENFGVMLKNLVVYLNNIAVSGNGVLRKSASGRPRKWKTLIHIGALAARFKFGSFIISTFQLDIYRVNPDV